VLYNKGDIMKGVVEIIMIFKRLLTLKVSFTNVLGKKKYKKNTKMPVRNICVLGISKL